jgi:hypothetical protein
MTPQAAQLWAQLLLVAPGQHPFIARDGPGARVPLAGRS